MKRMVFCVVIIVVIVAFGIFGLAYTSSVTDNITKDLEQVRREFTSGNTEAASAAAERVCEHWESFREKHFLTVDNDHSLEITMTAKRIKSFLEREDGEALTECDVMEELITVYGREQVPSIMNIL